MLILLHIKLLGPELAREFTLWTLVSSGNFTMEGNLYANFAYTYVFGNLLVYYTSGIYCQFHLPFHSSFSSSRLNPTFKPHACHLIIMPNLW